MTKMTAGSGKLYKITVEQKKVRRNQVTALHLMIGLLLIVMGFVAWMVAAGLKGTEFSLLRTAGLSYCAFGILLITISVFFNRRLIQNPIGNFWLRIVEIIVLLGILIYTLAEQLYLPFAYSAAALMIIIFAFFWERSSRHKKVITLDTEGIFIPGFFRSRSLNWQDVKRTMVKHNILTVDCHDNHLFQFYVGSCHPDDAKDKMNNFFAEMVESHESLPKDDW